MKNNNKNNDDDNNLLFKTGTSQCHTDRWLACCGGIVSASESIMCQGCRVAAYVGSLHLWCKREECRLGRARVTIVHTLHVPHKMWFGLAITITTTTNQ